jgi:hypothetical protein
MEGCNGATLDHPAGCLVLAADVLDIAMFDGDSSRMRSWLRNEAAYFLFAVAKSAKLFELKGFRKRRSCAPATPATPATYLPTYLRLAKYHMTAESSSIKGKA